MLQFRAEAFDVFNQASFGQPAPVVSTVRIFQPVIRLSRQIQLQVKLMF